MSVFVGYWVEQLTMERGTPQAYESSPEVTRSFCGTCGASLFYEDERLHREIYVAVGIFDEPERFQPDSHGWSSQKLVWLDIEDNLPHHKETSRPR